MKPSRISQTGVGSSDWIILDEDSHTDVSLQVEPGGGTVTIQATLDPALKHSRNTVQPSQIVDIADMAGLTANGVYTVKGPVKAVRINQTAGVGTSYLTAMA